MRRLGPRKIKIGFISVGVATILLFTFSVFGEEASRSTISREKAIAIAEARVKADGVMSLTLREPIANVEGDHWHVTFKWRQPSVFDPNLTGGVARELRVGGHPHVFIHNDGHLLNVFYTK
jgi:hypothetical protein